MQNIIFPVILYGYETWSLTLREEHRLRVFENEVLRRIFGPKRVDVTWGWRKLHNEELHNLYSSPNIIRMMESRRIRWVGHVARMGEQRNAYRILVGKPEGKRPLRRPRRGWWIILKLILKRYRMGWCWLNLSGSGQEPVQDSFEHGNKPSGSIKCWEVLE
jgi:hypothetical protein